MPKIKHRGNYNFIIDNVRILCYFNKKQKTKSGTIMKKALYIILLAVEAASLFFPLFLILYLNGLLVSIIAFLAVAAVYAFLGIRAIKQKKAGDEAALKKSKIFIALVCPAIWAVFIAYFLYVCKALGIM